MGLNAAAVARDGADYRGAGMKPALRLAGHFRQLSFDIPGGQWVSLLGASGAGKPACCGLSPDWPPTHGQVRQRRAPAGPRLAWMGQKICSIRG
jgi:ABC-type nitrate/sulfonate/bicarbonate transport system ATPase subunit